MARRPPPRLIALGVVISAAVAAAIVLRPAPADIESLLEDRGVLGPPLSVVAYALLTVALIPGSPLTIAAGALYGVAGGALVSVIGATIGATISYLISKRSTRGAVEQVRGDRIAAIEARLSGRGVWALLALRLVPIVPFNALNYAAGASGIGTRDYVLSTGFGIVPGAILYAAIGAGLANPLSPLFVIALVAALVLAFAAVRIAHRGGFGIAVDDPPPLPGEVRPACAPSEDS